MAAAPDSAGPTYAAEGAEVFATLVVVRHGQSVWNASNQFTGWVDCDLSELGVTEAQTGGKALADSGIKLDIMYTSFLKRAIKTGNIILECMDQLYIPVIKSWRLNERMYGGLQGLNKAETVAKHGKEQVSALGSSQVLIWRRSFDVPPPEIDADSEYNPAKEEKYKGLAPEDIPKTECLKDVIARAVPFWESDIRPSLTEGKNVLLAAHGNSIRAIVKFLDGITDADIPGLEIPTGIPLVYRFDKDLNIIPSKAAVAPLTAQFLADAETVRKAQEKVKHQIGK